MKVLLRIGITILVIIVLLLVVGIFLPQSKTITKSVAINASTPTVFAMINDVSNWEKWTYWAAQDTNTSYTYSTNTVGHGAWFNWKSKINDEGKFTINQSITDSLIAGELYMAEFSSTQRFLFTEKDDTCNVEWHFESKMGWNLFGRWMLLFMNDAVGDDLDNSLQRLKQVCESLPKPDLVDGFEVEKKMIPAQQYIYISHQLQNKQEVALIISESMLKLLNFVKQHNMEKNGFPFIIWNDSNAFSVALPVSNHINTTKDIKYNEELEYPAFVLKYYGAYDKNDSLYQSMFDYINNQGKQLVGAPREVYVSNPELEPNAANWLTEMIFPINN
jgi:effector-binding domain-containing protein